MGPETKRFQRVEAGQRTGAPLGSNRVAIRQREEIKDALVKNPSEERPDQDGERRPNQPIAQLAQVIDQRHVAREAGFVVGGHV